MNKVFALIATLLLFTSSAWATESDEAKISMATSQTVMLQATVVAINHETREVTLRGPEGRTVDLVASEEAKNLNQIKAGDLIDIQYEQGMSIEVFAADEAEAGAGAFTAVARPEEGATPAMLAIDALVVTAVVEEINLEANTFKLKGPSGAIKEFEARDPENLKKAAVGDLVVITYTEAIAMSLATTGE